MMFLVGHLSMITTAVISETPLYSLQLLDYNDLQRVKDRAVSSQLIVTLQQTGAIQINNIPGYHQARVQALSSLATCLEHDSSEGVISTPLHKEIYRKSTAAKTTLGQAGKMTSKCGESSKTLRSIVDHAVKLVFHHLDDSFQLSLKTDTDSTQSQKISVSAAMEQGEHLEHLHAYFPSTPTTSRLSESTANNSGSIDEEATLSMHTDVGIMIAMTAGYLSSTQDKPFDQSKQGLFITLNNQQVVKVDVVEDALILMIGEGAKWLVKKNQSQSPLRTVPHALAVKLPHKDATRSWYGKMYFPPLNTEVEGGITFKEFASKHIAAITSTNAASGVKSEYTVQDVNSCKDNELWCWMACRSVEGLPCGMSAECINTKNGDPWTGGMCNSCQLVCPASSPSLAPSSDSTMDRSKTSLQGASPPRFCYGMGTSMLMAGFARQSENPDAECINLWLPSWTLDTSSKYCSACVGLFLMGVFIQYLTKLRGMLYTYASISHSKQRYLFRSNAVNHSRILSAVDILLFGVQVTLSYLIMLAAMTYSTELFLMVCLGLTVGYGVFNKHDMSGVGRHSLSNNDPVNDKDSDSDMNALMAHNSSNTSHAFVEPCCAINDINDIQQTYSSSSTAINAKYRLVGSPLLGSSHGNSEKSYSAVGSTVA